METRLYQRISEREKYADDKKLAKDLVNTLAPEAHITNTFVSDYESDLRNYKLYNNQIEQDEFEEICNPLGLSTDYPVNTILPYNKIPNKINVLLGEEIKRNDTYTAYLLDEKSIKEKDEELRQVYIEYLTKQAEKAQQGDFQPDPIDVEYTKFLSQKEIFANAVIKYANATQNIKHQKNDGFKHALITDKEFVWVGLSNGKPIINTLNPLHVFYHKDPECKFIENGQYAGVRVPMLRARILELYGDKMSKDDLERFGFASSGLRKNVMGKKMDYHREDSIGQRFPSMYSSQPEKVGSQGPASNRMLMEDLVWVTHIEWKWLREIGYLTRINEFGEEYTDMVDSTFELPDDVETIEFTNRFGTSSKKYVWYDELNQYHCIEYVWIPRVWEATRIDGDIFVDVREKPGQPFSLEDPFNNCKLGYHGVIFTSMNASPVSLVDRMKPFQFLFFVAMNQMVKLISRNFGSVTDIDGSAIDLNLSDTRDPQEALERTLVYLREGIRIYNSLKDMETDSNTVMSRPAPSVSQLSNIQDINGLAQLCDWLDVQIGMAAGISPEREARFSANTNVTDNQQAIAQSSHITEVYFYKHNLLWKSVIESYISYFKKWAKSRLDSDSELILQYILPDTSISLLRVEKGLVEDSECGVYIMSSSLSDDYYNKMEQLSLTLLQNEQATVEDISNILKAKLTGISPEELHNILAKNSKKREEIINQQQQAQQQLEQQRLQLEQERHEDNQQQERDLIVLKGEQDRFTEQLKASLVADSTPVELLKISTEQEENQKDREHEDKNNEADRKIKEADIRAKAKNKSK